MKCSQEFPWKEAGILFFKMPVIIFFHFYPGIWWFIFLNKNLHQFLFLVMASKWGSWFCTQWHPWSGEVPKVNTKFCLAYFWNSSLLEHYPTCKNLLGFFSVLIGSLTKGRKPTCFSKCVVPVEVGISFFDVVSHNT
jgi:hypothetical protein